MTHATQYLFLLVAGLAGCIAPAEFIGEVENGDTGSDGGGGSSEGNPGDSGNSGMSGPVDPGCDSACAGQPWTLTFADQAVALELEPDQSLAILFAAAGEPTRLQHFGGDGHAIDTPVDVDVPADGGAFGAFAISDSGVAGLAFTQVGIEADDYPSVYLLNDDRTGVSWATVHSSPHEGDVQNAVGLGIDPDGSPAVLSTLSYDGECIGFALMNYRASDGLGDGGHSLYGGQPCDATQLVRSNGVEANVIALSFGAGQPGEPPYRLWYWGTQAQSSSYPQVGAGTVRAAPLGDRFVELGRMDGGGLWMQVIDSATTEPVAYDIPAAPDETFEPLWLAVVDERIYAFVRDSQNRLAVRIYDPAGALLEWRGVEPAVDDATDVGVRDSVTSVDGGLYVLGHDMSPTLGEVPWLRRMD